MRILGPVSEDEVLQCFVRAERDSERYGEIVRKLERRAGDNICDVPRAPAGRAGALPRRVAEDGGVVPVLTR